MPATLFLKGRELREIQPGIWRIDPTGKMRAGVHLVGSEKLLSQVKDDASIDQAVNVAMLPGVVDPVLTMPDIHQGYGFPIGGVAAFDARTGVVSPGGVGYDINCGIRLLKTPLTRDEVHSRDRMRPLVADLFDTVPSGVGSKRSDIDFTADDFRACLAEGAPWAVRKGFGTRDDLECIEEGGRLRGADPQAVSARALERGHQQLGTLGSGNHFLEIQYVDEIRDEEKARAFGLVKDQIVVSVHTGSRGLGYQVCSDYLELAIGASRKYGIELPERGLAAAPLDSDEGRAYLSAMSAAANFAFVNRQLITHWVREVFAKHFGRHRELELLYDVCHNIAKFEEMPFGRKLRTICVHRKGATRAYPPKHALVPARYREVGQPVLVPGDMGRYSFVLVGRKGSLEETFGSACHGAGREMSRSEAKRVGRGRPLARELEDRGIYVKSAGRDTILEEMPEAYKDVSDVVEATARAGVADIVCRLRPIGVVKG